MSIAVIFDMDGVLIDTHPYIIQSFNEYLKPYGIPFTDETNKEVNGMSLLGVTKLFKERYGVSIDHVDFSHQAGIIELELLEKEEKIDPALIEFLEKLKEKGIPMAVGTSSMRWRAERILDIFDLKKYFSVLITAEDVEKHKPEPDTYLKSAKELNVDPKECIVIEDAPHGITSAIRAGMKTVALLTKFHSKEEFSNANFIIENFEEINNSIKS